MMFPHHNMHKYTWTSPAGKTFDHIGHILMDKRQNSCIVGTHSFRGADSHTDHYLVVVVVRQRLSVSI
jgi:hypothetical protein